MYVNICEIRSCKYELLNIYSLSPRTISIKYLNVILDLLTMFNKYRHSICIQYLPNNIYKIFKCNIRSPYNV